MIVPAWIATATDPATLLVTPIVSVATPFAFVFSEVGSPTTWVPRRNESTGTRLSRTSGISWPVLFSAVAVMVTAWLLPSAGSTKT